MHLPTTIFACIGVLTTSAFASQADATKCAAGLDANGQMIFGAVLPQVTPATDLRGAVTDATRSLVISGKIPRAAAKPAAEAAGACLKLAKQ